MIGQATLSGGTIALHWSGRPGVTRYEVRFYSADQVERGLASTTDTSWSRSLDQLGFPIDTARVVLVRVRAVGDDGSVSLSPARPLTRR